MCGHDGPGDSQVTSIVNFHPTNEFRALEEMFDRVFGTPSQPTTQILPIDILEENDTLIVRAQFRA